MLLFNLYKVWEVPLYSKVLKKIEATYLSIKDILTYIEFPTVIVKSHEIEAFIIGYHVY